MLHWHHAINVGTFLERACRSKATQIRVFDLSRSFGCYQQRHRVNLVAADATHDVTGDDMSALSVAGLDAFGLELRQCLVNGIQDNVRQIIDRKLEFDVCQTIWILRCGPLAHCATSASTALCPTLGGHASFNDPRSSTPARLAADELH